MRKSWDCFSTQAVRWLNHLDILMCSHLEHTCAHPIEAHSCVCTPLTPRCSQAPCTLTHTEELLSVLMSLNYFNLSNYLSNLFFFHSFLYLLFFNLVFPLFSLAFLFSYCFLEFFWKKYLFQRQSDRSSILWFIFQMSATAWGRPSWI